MSLFQSILAIYILDRPEFKQVDTWPFLLSNDVFGQVSFEGGDNFLKCLWRWCLMKQYWCRNWVTPWLVRATAHHLWRGLRAESELWSLSSGIIENKFIVTTHHSATDRLLWLLEFLYNDINTVTNTQNGRTLVTTQLLDSTRTSPNTRSAECVIDQWSPGWSAWSSYCHIVISTQDLDMAKFLCPAD